MKFDREIYKIQVKLLPVSGYGIKPGTMVGTGSKIHTKWHSPNHCGRHLGKINGHKAIYILTCQYIQDDFLVIFMQPCLNKLLQSQAEICVLVVNAKISTCRSQHVSVESSSLLHHSIYLWFICFTWWFIDELENLHADRTTVCFEPW